MNTLVFYFSGLLISYRGHPLSKHNQKQASKEVLDGMDHSGQALWHWKGQKRAENCSGLEVIQSEMSSCSVSLFFLIYDQNIEETLA